MFKNLKVGKKLFCLIVIAIVIAMIIGIAGIVAMKKLSYETDVVGRQKMPIVIALSNISSSQQMVVICERYLVNRRITGTIRNAQYDRIAITFAEADKTFEEYEALPHAAEALKSWNEFKTLWNEWKSGVQEIIRKSQAKDQLTTQGKRPHLRK